MMDIQIADYHSRNGRKRNPWVFTGFLLTLVLVGTLALMAKSFSAGEFKLNLRGGLEITDCKYRKHDSGSVIELEMKLTNSGEAVGELWFYVQRRNDGRTVPDVESIASHKIRGGLESGEVASIKFYVRLETAWDSEAPVRVGVIEAPEFNLIEELQNAKLEKAYYKKYAGIKMVTATEVNPAKK